MSELRQWLEQHGLAKYEELLAENEIDFEVLPELEEVDLEKLGLALGPRKKILKAIRELNRATSANSTQELPRRASPSGEAERRQLTVMFADLVGSTELSRTLDPEDLRDVNRAYLESATAAIEKYEGFVARYMGDGVLAYFGYPRAHEDDAERALRAGLELVDSVRTLKTGVALSVRVGVATGPVVVGDLVGQGAARESAVVGETPNLAARLQGIAHPNTVVLSAATQRLVGDRFDLDALPHQSLKGMGQPVKVYRALAIREVSRFDAARKKRVTPLVGRDEELEMLHRRWKLAVEGEGQAVLLSGEAGVGKSRIVQALQDSLGDVPFGRVLYYCSPYHQSTAFYPVIEQLQRVTRMRSGQTAREKVVSLRSMVGELGLEIDETVPYFAELLSIPYQELHPPLELTPEGLREKTLDVLVEAVEAMAAREPTLFAVEDMHWIDPSTQDFLTRLVERIRKSRALVVVTHRPEYQSPWTGYPHVTAVALNNLGRRDSAALVAEVTGRNRLPTRMVEDIIDRTDGVPLFIEEVTAALGEVGLLADDEETNFETPTCDTTAIPATLHDLLMERLDRLGPAKEIGQLAAVIGRSFDFELLRTISDRDEQTLERDLARLVQSGLVFGRRRSGSNYDFKHALVRDVAYQSLLKRKRQRCHLRIAAAMLQAGSENAPLELLAHHFEEGGHPDKAAQYWRKAGERALARFAHLEAISDFRRALVALESIPENADRLRFELEVQTLLGPSLMYVYGQGAPEVEKTYARALALGERLDDPKSSFTSAWGMWRLQFARGEMRVAQESALKCRQVSSSRQDPVASLGAAFALGATDLFSGNCAAAAAHLEDSIALYRDMDDKSALAVFGQDPGLSSLAYLAWARWLLGFPGQAIGPCAEAVQLARDIGKPVLIAITTGFAGLTYLIRRDIQRLTEYAEECSSICERHGFRQHAAMGNIMLGYAYSHHGDHDRAMRMIENGVDEKVALRSYIALPWFCYLAAEVYVAARRLGKALEMSRKGIAFASRGGERLFESENHRVQAIILAQDGNVSREEVQAHFENAFELAKNQGAKSLELRAATSFARFANERGDGARACEVLFSIYDSFTEGFDTPDLEEAKATLAFP